MLAPTGMQQARAPLSVWLSALAIALVVFSGSHLLEPVSRVPFNFGEQFAAMSRDPFAFTGMFPQRVLGPALAWACGLGGDRYWLFSHATSVALLTAIAATVMLRGGGFLAAALTTVALAGTGAVAVYKNHVGYADELTFLLLLLGTLAVRRPAVFWSVQLLNLLNHEQVLFLWPWLVFWRWRHGPWQWRRDPWCMAIVIGLYVAFRLWVGQVAPAQHLDTEYYQRHHYFPVGTLGLTALAMCALGIYFALLPSVVFWQVFVEGWRQVGVGVVLYGACIVGIFTVAHDVYRFASLVFLPIVLACARASREPRGWLGLALLAVSTPVLTWLQLRHDSIFHHIVVHVFDCGCFDNMPRIVTCVIPRLWYVFVAYAGVLALCAGIGWWAARRRHAAAPLR